MPNLSVMSLQEMQPYLWGNPRVEVVMHWDWDKCHLKLYFRQLNYDILIKISLNFILECSIDNKPTLVQVNGLAPEIYESI